jgi:hypothetical protein
LLNECKTIPVIAHFRSGRTFSLAAFPVRDREFASLRQGEGSLEWELKEECRAGRGAISGNDTKKDR